MGPVPIFSKMFSFLHRRRDELIHEQRSRIRQLESENAKLCADNAKLSLDLNKLALDVSKLDLQLYHVRLLTHVATDLDALKEIAQGRSLRRRSPGNRRLVGH
jgi:hypothetical protein